nr:unnamed protein product [uncultured bacterium]
MKLNARIYFRCTETEKKELFDLCKIHGVSVQNYCRSKILNSIKKDYLRYRKVCLNCGHEVIFKQSKDGSSNVAKCPSCGFVATYPIKKNGDIK